MLMYNNYINWYALVICFCYELVLRWPNLGLNMFFVYSCAMPINSCGPVYSVLILLLLLRPGCRVFWLKFYVQFYVTRPDFTKLDSLCNILQHAGLLLGGITLLVTSEAEHNPMLAVSDCLCSMFKATPCQAENAFIGVVKNWRESYLTMKLHVFFLFSRLILVARSVQLQQFNHFGSQYTRIEFLPPREHTACPLQRLE